MNVLCTGGAGFIGSHVAKHLITAGHSAIVLDNLDGGRIENIPEGAKFLHGDVRRFDQVNRAFEREGIEAVVHAAAYASEGLSHWCRRHVYENNVIGTANVVNACVNHGVKVLAFVSSAAVYGNARGPFGDIHTAKGPVEYFNFREHGIHDPIDPYGAAKNLSEIDVETAGDVFSLPWIIFRPHNVIGERQNMADRTRNFVSIAIRHALEGKSIPIYGDGQQVRQFSPVAHVAGVIGAAIDRPTSWGRIFNVGDNEAMTINAMADLVCELTGSRMPHRYLEQRHEAKSCVCHHGLQREHFSDIPRGDIRQTIMEMIDEAKASTILPYQDHPHLEITVNAPAWAKDT